MPPPAGFTSARVPLVNKAGTLEHLDSDGFQHVPAALGVPAGYVLASGGPGVRPAWSPLSGVSVASVFGRTGAVVAMSTDYASFYQPLNATLTSFAALANAAGVLTNDGAGNLSWTAAGGGGTVTSAGLAMPSSIFDVTGSPVSTSGTLTASLKSQAAGLFLASPALASGAPTMRAIASTDLPGTISANTNGSAATLGTARTLTIGSAEKTFNGSLDVSWSLAEIGALPAPGTAGNAALFLRGDGVWSSTLAGSGAYLVVHNAVISNDAGNNWVVHNAAEASWGHAFQSNGTNLLTLMTNAASFGIDVVTNSAIKMTGSGVGTYNAGAIFCDSTDGIGISRPRVTDSGSAAVRPFYISQRGGGTKVFEVGNGTTYHRQAVASTSHLTLNGATRQPWGAGRNALTLGGTVAIEQVNSSGDYLILHTNCYFDGTDNRSISATGASSQLAITPSGALDFETVANNGANGVVSLARKMRVDGSGMALASLTAGGIVKAASTTGLLSLASSSDLTSAITSPTFTGGAGFDFLTSTAMSSALIRIGDGSSTHAVSFPKVATKSFSVAGTADFASMTVSGTITAGRVAMTQTGFAITDAISVPDAGADKSWAFNCETIFNKVKSFTFDGDGNFDISAAPLQKLRSILVESGSYELPTVAQGESVQILFNVAACDVTSNSSQSVTALGSPYGTSSAVGTYGHGSGSNRRSSILLTGVSATRSSIVA